MSTPVARPRGIAMRIASTDLAVMFMGSTLVTPLYGVYRDTFGFSEVTLTLIYAAYVIGNLAALFFFGRLSDQIGRKRVTFAALAIACASTLTFLFAASTPWLFVARALSGLAIGLASGAAAAWIAELTERQNKHRATVAATIANFAGLAAGAIITGMLAQYAPAPLRVTYLVYLVLLGMATFLIARSQETVRNRATSIQETSLSPRIGVPRDIRSRFLSPAVTAFATFSLMGFYIALLPTLLDRDMDLDNLALSGAVVGELLIVAALAVYLTASITSRTAMLRGSALLIPSVSLLVAAQASQSLPMMLVGTAVSGTAAALGYRGSMQLVNEMAPNDKRAEIISTYQIVCYLGNSLPVVGVGVVSSFAGPMTATASLAIVVALLAIVAIAIELRRGRGEPGKGSVNRRGPAPGQALSTSSTGNASQPQLQKEIHRGSQHHIHSHGIEQR